MTREQLKSAAISTVKFVATIGGLLFAVVIVLSALQYARADSLKSKNRLASEVCAELGLMAVDATNLVFQTDAQTALHQLTLKYPRTAQYAPMILQVVLTPPIEPPEKMRKQVVEQCLKSNTINS